MNEDDKRNARFFMNIIISAMGVVAFILLVGVIFVVGAKYGLWLV